MQPGNSKKATTKKQRRNQLSHLSLSPLLPSSFINRRPQFSPPVPCPRLYLPPLLLLCSSPLHSILPFAHCSCRSTFVHKPIPSTMITPTSYNNTTVFDASPPGYWGHPTASGMLGHNCHVSSRVSISHTVVPNQLFLNSAFLFLLYTVGKLIYLSVGVLNGITL